MGSSSHSTPKSVKPKSGDTSESTKHYRIRKSADRLAARHFSPFPSHWALGLVAWEFVCFIKYHESGDPLAFFSNRRIRFRVQKQVMTMSTRYKAFVPDGMIPSLFREKPIQYCPSLSMICLNIIENSIIFLKHCYLYAIVQFTRSSFARGQQPIQFESVSIQAPFVSSHLKQGCGGPIDGQRNPGLDPPLPVACPQRGA